MKRETNTKPQPAPSRAGAITSERRVHDAGALQRRVEHVRHDAEVSPAANLEARLVLEVDDQVLVARLVRDAERREAGTDEVPVRRADEERVASLDVAGRHHADGTHGRLEDHAAAAGLELLDLA